jgi:putative transposase
MYLTEKQIIKENNINYKLIDKACFECKNLRNYALYCVKKEHEQTGKFLSYDQLDKLMKKENQKNYKAICANAAQQVLRDLCNEINSFKSAIKDWKTNPSKYRKKPEFPK